MQLLRMLIAALPALTLASSVVALPGPVGDWRRQDTSRTFATAFANGPRTFEAATDAKSCGNFSVYFGPPDGLTPDYGQALTAALETASRLGGGSVRLAGGTYPILSPVVLGSRTCLFGAGHAKTILKVGWKFDRFYAGRGIVRARRASNVTMMGFTVLGATSTADSRHFYSRDAVVLDLVNYALIRGVRAHDHAGAGFLVAGSRTRYAMHIALEKCVGHRLGGPAFDLRQVHYAAIAGGHARKIAGHGVRIAQGSVAVLVRNTDVVNVAQCGVSVEPGDGIGTIGPVPPREVRIQGGVLLNARVAGVCLQGINDVHVTATQITNMRDAGSACYHLLKATYVGKKNQCRVSSGIKVAPKNSTPRALPIPQSAGLGCNGLLFREVCCPKTCGLCGGPGCGTRGSGGECCALQIRKRNASCKFHAPPCIVR